MVAADVNPTYFETYRASNDLTYYYLTFGAIAFTTTMVCRYGTEFFARLAGRSHIITNIDALITTTAANERSVLTISDFGIRNLNGQETESADASYRTTFYGPWGPLKPAAATSPLLQFHDGYTEWSGNVNCYLTVYGRIYDTATEPSSLPDEVIVKRMDVFPWKR